MWDTNPVVRSADEIRAVVEIVMDIMIIIMEVVIVESVIETRVAVGNADTTIVVVVMMNVRDVTGEEIVDREIIVEVPVVMVILIVVIILMIIAQHTTHL
jgi:hypothetical protein